MNIGAELAARLLQIKAIQLNVQNPFTWSSGWKSPIYCDNRLTLSYPEVRNFIKSALYMRLQQLPKVDAVAGVATAGIPHAALLADAAHLPMLYVRDKAKKHGMKNRIEGRLPEGAEVLVVEDLISTGGSSLKAVEAIREAGGKVVGVLALFSYGFDKAEKAFKEANCQYHALCSYEQLLDKAKRAGYINQTEVESLSAWRHNPAEWGDHLSR